MSTPHKLSLNYLIIVSLSTLSILGSDQVLGLSTIPKNVKIDSRLILSGPAISETITISEYVNSEEASVKIKVSKDSQENGYYRIRESSGEKLDEERVIKHDSASNLCYETSTREWELQPLTEILGDLANLEQEKFKQINRDRTAIGPSGLLKFVHANSELFIANLKAFDQTDLIDTFYFSTLITTRDAKYIRLVASIAAPNVRDRKSVEIGKTSLKDVDTEVFVSRISALYLDEGTKSEDLQKLLRIDSLNRVIVSYLIVRDRSYLNFLDLNLTSEEEQDPFMLPVGAGCGIVSGHALFYIGSKQFSGRYEAQDLQGEHSIGMDETSSHLRIDRVGEHKIIYNLRQKQSVFVLGSAAGIDDDRSDFEDKCHCSQMTLTKALEKDEGIFDAKLMKEVFGFGPDVGLGFLGGITLEDGTYCLVFEREIALYQVPAFCKLNLRLRFGPAGRFFLIFFLVDGGSSEPQKVFNSPQAYESMWLKRVELHSRSSLFKYGFLNSRVTFAESSWSLESIAENQRLANTMHPVRAFDIGECKSIHEQLELSMVIKQTESSSSLTFAGDDFFFAGQQSYQVHNTITSIEEGLMIFLTRQLGVPRMHISWLKVDPLKDSRGDYTGSLLVEARLVASLNFKIETLLLGWLKTVHQVTTDNKATMITLETGLSRHGCLLRLGIELINMKGKFTAMFCPNYGCGYIGSDLKEVDYIKDENSDPSAAPLISNYFYMCELYDLTRSADHDRPLITAFSPERVQTNLNRAKISVDLPDEQTEFNQFHGQVEAVSVSKPEGHETLGSLLMDEFCFTSNVKSAKLGGYVEREIMVIELTFDLQQSLIQCYKACHLSSLCLTFSYDTSTRTCVLTNIEAKVLADKSPPSSKSIVDSLKHDSNCKVYSLNAVHLYKRDSGVWWTTAAFLTNNGYTFESGDANDCANLCHQYELITSATEEVFLCQKFVYLRLMATCAIHDENYHLLRRIRGGFSQDDRIYYNKRTLDSKFDWYETDHGNLYSKDFEQFYTKLSSTKLEIVRLSQQVGLGSTNQESEREAVSSQVLYDLDYERCLYECTVLDLACVAVDHCSGTTWVTAQRSCTLYYLRSPFTLRLQGGQAKLTADATGDSTLTALEQLYYVEGKSSAHSVTAKNSSCTHSFLSGDYLRLKRQTTSALLLNSSYVKKLSLSAHRDLEKSLKFLSDLAKFRNDANSHRRTHFGIIAATVPFLLGNFLGVLIFVYRSGLFETLESSTVPARARLLRWWTVVKTRASRDRSNSMVQFNDLGEIELCD